MKPFKITLYNRNGTLKPYIEHFHSIDEANSHILHYIKYHAVLAGHAQCLWACKR